MAHQATLSITNSWSLLKLISIEPMMPSNYLILCHPLLLLPSVFPSIRIFSSESVLHIRWPKDWSFGFSISTSNEYSGVNIHFTLDWLVGSLCSPSDSQESSLTSQLKSINSSVLSFLKWSNSHIMTTGKTISLTRWTFVVKVMSLLFNMLYRLLIAFFPRSKHLLISGLQSPFAVILKPRKIKLITISNISPSICHEVIGPDAMILVLWMLSFKPAFSLFSFTFIKRLFSSSSLFVIRVVPSAYLRLLIFLPAVLIPACASHTQRFSWCTLLIN